MVAVLYWEYGMDLIEDNTCYSDGMQITIGSMHYLVLSGG